MFWIETIKNHLNNLQRSHDRVSAQVTGLERKVAELEERLRGEIVWRSLGGEDDAIAVYGSALATWLAETPDAVKHVRSAVGHLATYGFLADAEQTAMESLLAVLERADARSARESETFERRRSA